MKSYDITIRCIDEHDLSAVLGEIMELALTGTTSGGIFGNFSYDGVIHPYSATIQVSINNADQTKGKQSVIRQGISKKKGLAKTILERKPKV